MIRAFMLAAIALAAFAADPVPPGAKAPPFTLTSAEGKPVSLADHAGKTVVLEWVNYDCPFVKKHYQSSGNIPKLQAEAKAAGVVWLSICSSAPGKQGHFAGAELTARIAAEKAVPTAYLIDADGAVGKAYGAATTPQIVIVDKDGVVRYHGAIDSIRSTDAADIAKATNHVSAALADLAANRPVATAQTKSYGCGVKY
ncbi:MAG: thioredoxin family protein [Planctomycetes bacterium]|nr:thioredoxin family protein [Planctomycetota bacterium]